MMKTHSPVCSNRVLPNLSLSHFASCAADFLLVSMEARAIGRVRSSIDSIFRAHSRQLCPHHTTPSPIHDAYAASQASKHRAGNGQANAQAIILATVALADLIKPFEDLLLLFARYARSFIRH